MVWMWPFISLCLTVKQEQELIRAYLKGLRAVWNFTSRSANHQWSQNTKKLIVIDYNPQFSNTYFSKNIQRAPFYKKHHGSKCVNAEGQIYVCLQARDLKHTHTHIHSIYHHHHHNITNAYGFPNTK